LQAARVYGMNWTIQNWRTLTEAIKAMVQAENPGRCLVPIYRKSGIEKEPCYAILPCELHESQDSREKKLKSRFSKPSNSMPRLIHSISLVIGDVRFLSALRVVALFLATWHTRSSATRTSTLSTLIVLLI